MSGKSGLIAAAFSAYIGIQIKTETEATVTLQTEGYPRYGNVPVPVTTTTLFGYSSNRLQGSNCYTVKVFGHEDGFECNVNPNSAVGDIKQAFASVSNIPRNQWQNTVLLYGGKKLDDSKTPQQLHVPLGSTMCLAHLGAFDGPKPTYYIRDCDLEPTKDYDFSNLSKSEQRCERGGYVYDRPIGWHRCALKVIGKYENDIWLGEDGWRDKSTPGEWAVSYHGTAMTNIGSIAHSGFDVRRNKRQLFGEGIYSTPSIKVASSYATEFTYNGRKYKVVLQNRLNLEYSKEVPAWETGAGASYFVTENADDIRPYGVCLKDANWSSYFMM